DRRARGAKPRGELGVADRVESGLQKRRIHGIHRRERRRRVWRERRRDAVDPGEVVLGERRGGLVAVGGERDLALALIGAHDLQILSDVGGGQVKFLRLADGDAGFERALFTALEIAHQRLNERQVRRLYRQIAPVAV